jgi:hypothetical protein
VSSVTCSPTAVPIRGVVDTVIDVKLEARNLHQNVHAQRKKFSANMNAQDTRTLQNMLPTSVSHA